jgi:hypothetical protein
MKRRRFLFVFVFAGLLVLAVLGAAAQAVRGSKPLLLAASY